MGKHIPLYINVLQTELTNRQSRNPGYSLRAFANSLGVDASYLSKCLAKKQAMSLEIAEKVIEKLHLSVESRAQFLHSIAEFQKCHSLLKHDENLTDCH